jgi:hypothetical protein
MDHKNRVHQNVPAIMYLYGSRQNEQVYPTRLVECELILHYFQPELDDCRNLGPSNYRFRSDEKMVAPVHSSRPASTRRNCKPHSGSIYLLLDHFKTVRKEQGPFKYIFCFAMIYYEIFSNYNLIHYTGFPRYSRGYVPEKSKTANNKTGILGPN